MKFINKSQINNIYREISNLGGYLAVLESSTASLSDIILTKADMIDALEKLSTSLDTIDRKWISPDVVTDIDNKVADLVRRYNLAKTQVQFTHGASVDFADPDKYWVNFDKKSSNELDVSSNSETQKVFSGKRVKAVVKEAVTLGLVVALLGGATFFGIRQGIANNHLKEANAQVQQLQEENEALQVKISELLLRIAVLEDQLENAGLSDSERVELQAEIDALKDKLADAVFKKALLIEENDGLKALITKLQSDLEKSNALVESLKAQLAANPNDANLKKLLNEALKENELLKSQVNALSIENEEYKNKITILSDEYNKIKAENEKLKDKESPYDAEIAALQEVIDGLNLEIGRLAAALTTSQNEVKRLQGIINKGGLTDAERAKYESTIETLKKSNESLQNQLILKTNEYNTLLTKYGTAVSEKEALSKENNELKEEIKSFEDLTAFIDEYYLDTMGRSGKGLTSIEKLTGLFGYFLEKKPTSEDYQKLEAVYAFLTQIYGPSDIVYGDLTLAEFRAVLDQIAGGMQATPGDVPSGSVYEDESWKNESGNGGSNNSSTGNSTTTNGDTHGRIPGDM